MGANTNNNNNDYIESNCDRNMAKGSMGDRFVPGF